MFGSLLWAMNDFNKMNEDMCQSYCFDINSNRSYILKEAQIIKIISAYDTGLISCCNTNFGLPNVFMPL